MTIKDLAGIFLILGLLGWALIANAGGRKPPVINNYHTHNTYVLEDCYVGGANVALDQIEQDWHTNDAQWGFGFGLSCDETGAGFGMAQKYNGVMYNGSVGYDEINKTQVGIGINGRF